MIGEFVRAIKYLQGTLDIGTVLEGQNNLQLRFQYPVVEYCIRLCGCILQSPRRHEELLRVCHRKMPWISLREKYRTEIQHEEQHRSGASGAERLEIVWRRRFLEQQGYTMDPAAIHQGNLLTLARA